MYRNFTRINRIVEDSYRLSIRDVSSKSTTKKKWQGRLEYLNRGDPFADKSEQNSDDKEKSVDSKDEKKNIKVRARVYVWGNAECGALGQLGFLQPRGVSKPLFEMRRPFISSLSNYYNLKTVACGYGFTLFVTDDKEKYLFGTGLNSLGQLGYQRRLTESGRQTGQPLETLIVPSAIQLPLRAGEKVVKVAAGRTHSLALSSQGRVMSWGNNCYGQCGRPIIENENYFKNQVIHEMRCDERVEDIVCGQDHSLLVTCSGQVLSCGWGADGQTGQGHYENSGDLRPVAGDLQGERIVKVSCAGDCVLALREGFKKNLKRFFNHPPPLKDIFYFEVIYIIIYPPLEAKFHYFLKYFFL